MPELKAVVKVPEGYGLISKSNYEQLPRIARLQIEILAICPSEEKARFIFSCLPQEWCERRSDAVSEMRV